MHEKFKKLLQKHYNVSDKAFNTVMEAKAILSKTETFSRIESVAQYNSAKVLAAFKNNDISARHFAQTTGYGYDDIGRDSLEHVFANVLGTQDALVRPQFASGTHAIAMALFGLLLPGDEMLSITGKPYDTLEEAIGIRGQAHGSLKQYNISYAQVDLENSKINTQQVISKINDKTKIIYLQRSRGYAWRDSLCINDIKEAVSKIKALFPKLIFVCDNCYGEFCDIQEPTDVGVDIIVGSLIKNIGGGIAPTGAYIAGTSECIEKIANRMTSPGIGREVGSYAASYIPFFQGLFLAPNVTAQSIKGAALASYVFEKLGFEVLPKYFEERNDIIQSIKFENEELLVRFCQSVQKASPIDSGVLPLPWSMPGYENEVIMAAGTFNQGASIELSADAPIKPPYIAYLQGGLTFDHVCVALMVALSDMDILNKI